MKKFLMGLAIGIGLASTTAVYASDTIQAYLFPEEIVINGHFKKLDGTEYSLLNYNGHAYVPVRYIAENMGAYVEYEEGSAYKRIGILHLEPKKPVISDKNYPNIHIGNIDILQNSFSNQSVISGVIAFDPGDVNQGHVLQFNLNFYNKDKSLLGTAKYVGKEPIKDGQIKAFTIALYGDVRNYETMSVDVTQIANVPN
jgi:hypothetical protein